jgi:nitroreductase
MDIFEVMGTCRAIRQLKPDPVPNNLIQQILEAGTCAANGSLSPALRSVASIGAKLKDTRLVA